MNNLTGLLRVAHEQVPVPGEPSLYSMAADRIEELEAALREQRNLFAVELQTYRAAWGMDDIARRALGDTDDGV